ncbi:hypothetical protein AB4Y32_08400 [Paraburkholderia phymatum]|uniref:Uncharacterized protein n=1 Tax=Paraburkholderia phymatum TaxID=148447 RepID=A0ACC6TWU7_9BURK
MNRLQEQWNNASPRSTPFVGTDGQAYRDRRCELIVLIGGIVAERDGHVHALEQRRAKAARDAAA